MNRVYWDTDKICFLTDKMNTEVHSHWMIQLFLCLEEDLELWVDGEYVSGRCIVVNRNIQHVFRCMDQWHLSILLEPTSAIDKILSQRMGMNSYCVPDATEIIEVQKLARKMITNVKISYYQKVVDALYTCLDIDSKTQQYDQRVEEVLRLIEQCTCDNHLIAEYAKEINISQSRLVHLFRQQIGLPLKNYILLHQMKKVFLALAEGKSITQAALDAGFDTPSHFAATTKKMMGISASQSLKDSQFLKVERKIK